MGRSPKCKTCVSYTPNADGTVVCEYSGKSIDVESKPLYDACYEKRQKKKLSPAELSMVRSIAGKKGGKKAGYGKGRAPTKQMSVRLPDYKVFVGYSRKKNHAMAEQFHLVASQMLEEHPELKPPEWID